MALVRSGANPHLHRTDLINFGPNKPRACQLLDKIDLSASQAGIKNVFIKQVSIRGCEAVLARRLAIEQVLYFMHRQF